MSGDTVAVEAASHWPADAEDVEEGVLANWFAREGKRVRAGETLCEIQVEKVSIDVDAPVAGELVERVVPEGGEFRRDAVLARISPSE